MGLYFFTRKWVLSFSQDLWQAAWVRVAARPGFSGRLPGFASQQASCETKGDGPPHSKALDLWQALGPDRRKMMTVGKLFSDGHYFQTKRGIFRRSLFSDDQVKFSDDHYFPTIRWNFPTIIIFRRSGEIFRRTLFSDDQVKFSDDDHFPTKRDNFPAITIFRRKGVIFRRSLFSDEIACFQPILFFYTGATK